MPAGRTALAKSGSKRGARVPRALSTRSEVETYKLDVSKLQQNAKGKFKVYVDQLATAELPRSVVTDIQSLGELENLYGRRSAVEDAAAAFGIIGVILMLAAAEIMAAGAEEAHAEAEITAAAAAAANNATYVHPLRPTFADTTTTAAIKAVISATTLVLVLLLVERSRINTEVKKLRNLLPPHASLWNNSRTFPKLLFEVVVCAFHIPPGVDFEGTFRFADSQFHVNDFGVIMLLRFYLFARVLRNHSGYYSRMVAFIGSLHDVDSTSIFFTFKMMFKEKSWKLLVPLMLLCICINTVCVRILERSDPASDINSYYDALWLTVVTMSTVGYGDISPVTFTGRMVNITFAIAGGALLMTMITAVFIDFLTLSESENIVVNSIKQRESDRRIREWASHLIQNAWALKKLHARMKEPTPPQGLAKQAKALSGKVFFAMHKVRSLRRSRPHEQDELVVRLDRLEEKLDRVLEVLAARREKDGGPASPSRRQSWQGAGGERSGPLSTVDEAGRGKAASADSESGGAAIGAGDVELIPVDGKGSADESQGRRLGRKPLRSRERHRARDRLRPSDLTRPPAHGKQKSSHNRAKSESQTIARKAAETK